MPDGVRRIPDGSGSVLMLLVDVDLRSPDGRSRDDPPPKFLEDTGEILSSSSDSSSSSSESTKNLLDFLDGFRVSWEDEGEMRGLL